MKKIIVALAMLIITVTVGYAYYNSVLSAVNSTYNAGGNITGRINKMPVGVSSSTSGMQKGDKVLTNIDNSYTGDKLGWQLIQSQTYTDYGCSTITACNGLASITSWQAMSDKPIGKTIATDSTANYVTPPGVSGVQWKIMEFKKTKIYPYITSLNESIKKSAIDAKLVAYRNLTYLHEVYQAASSNSSAKHIQKQLELAIFSSQELMLNAAYVNSYYDYAGRTASPLNLPTILPVKDLTFSEAYFNSNTYHDIQAGGVLDSFVYFADEKTGTVGNAAVLPKNSVNTEYAIRPSVYLNLADTVFAVSRGNDAGLGTIQATKVPSTYSSLYNETKEDPASGKNMPMKLRLYNVDLTASLSDIKNSSGNSITKATKDTTIKLSANANVGNDGAGGVYTVSAILFDENNNFAYYKPLESAKGNGSYTFDLTGVPVGKYKVAVVNEAYNEQVTSPADSSLISSVLPMEIVEPVSVSASAKTGLEYSKNVNSGNTVASYATSNGVAPITATVVSDTSKSGHENDYQLFAISNGNINVKGPNGLDAGDYYFKVNVIDSNGDPAGGADSMTVHINVAKTNLTAVFDNTAITKKGIEESKSSWNETATSTPNSGTKVTYSVNGGDIGLIDIDANTGAITYKGNGAFGKVEIKATADDDPAGSKDNYNAADTTKEIVIYREVDGSVEPHSNSSDKSTPTFTAADNNIKVGGTIGTIKGSKGTPNEIGGNTTTYTFGLKTGGNANFFAVDANSGAITSTANLAVGTYNITVTVADKWSTKDIPVTINVGMAKGEDLKFYENSSSSTAISTKSVKITDSNITVYATVKGSSNTNPVTYKVKDGSTNVVEVNSSSGAITTHGVGTVTIVAEKQGSAGQANANAELTLTVTAGAQNFIYTDDAGNELPKSGNNYSVKTETYEPNKTIQLYTAGNPSGATVTYQLKSGSPMDVISIDSSGLVKILNASQTAQLGKVIVQAVSHDPSGNYEDKTIELPINIDKGTRTIAFKENPIYVASGNGNVTPVIEVDGVVDTDGDVLIEVDSNEDSSLAWTSDNKSINYDYSEADAKDIKIHATKPMNRNYKVAEADGVLHIMGPDENVLAITSPGKITYGDHFAIRSSQYDADSTNVKYTFEIDDTTYISTPTVNGNSAQFDALKYSGTNKTTITVTRTADGETPLSKKVQVTVLAKSIKITIDNQEKLKGEQNPALTYQDFRSQLVSWNAVKDVIQENDIKLSTTAKTDSSAGSYPIKGDASLLNRTYPNYSFTYQEGTLTIKEDVIEDDWYHLELDDGNSTAYTGNWTNKDILVITDHNEYVNMSLDQSTWKPQSITVTKEGETNQSFWMKKDSGAITKEKQEIIRIDKTPPKIKGIKAKDTNNKLQDIINQLSGGIFFKPGTAFEITTSDAKDDLKVSGTKEITYKVYKVLDQARAGDELIKDGSLTVTNEKASITISELIGTYKVCVTPTDNAGNTNTESCHELELKKIDVDVDGDGKPDFNDPDGDGCPDLNIKWKDPSDETKWIVINGDRNYDGIPDLNIDSDGDGKPDLNIDTDKDGKPDLNLVILKKSDWKPTICVKQDIDNGILEEYCTGTSVKAVINIDTDNDGVPNINIDNKGDFKAHINISKNGETPIINIATIHEWKPELNKQSNGFSFDTMAIDEKKDVLLNIDTDEDGRPDVNIDLDNDGKPDINIDTDFDWIPDIDIDSTGDGNPDTNIDIDDDGIADENIVEITEWKPNKNVDGNILYDTMDFTEPTDPSNPDNPDNPNNPVDFDKQNDQGNNTDVKGSYYPGDNVGGAITGDVTDIELYLVLMILCMGSVSYLIYSYQKNTFQ